MTDIIGAFTGVWTALTSFLMSLFPTLLELFWADGSLTFIGVMAVITAGVSLLLLVFNLIRSFFRMRG